MTLTASTQASTLPLPGARTLQPGRGPLLCRSLGSQRQFLQTPAGSTETRDPLRPEWPDWQRDSVVKMNNLHQ
ncbi:hypothetical protein JZ751_006626 [Albula glossodonta]|uniref:Uncharacterized protein n=1 Tax=Albula glossodonta TaxID=121402 RepID=A0A8T2P150_9TELE|nr:hypothetical protein JZ751_006626 [Albula glossodonta]